MAMGQNQFGNHFLGDLFVLRSFSKRIRVYKVLSRVWVTFLG